MVETVRAARERRGLSQSELAVAANCSWSYVSRIECGAQTLTPTLAARFAAPLGVDPEALVRGQRELREAERERLLAGSAR
jgi:transcriptional regulator with XRE-family HTH domain